MTKEKYAGTLRQQIMATIKRTTDIDHHELLQDWGYGSSLRKIRDIEVLKEILAIARGEGSRQDSGVPGIGKLDDQGRYAWSLMKDRGWNSRRLRFLMIKTCGVGTWDQLFQKEKRQIINILKGYSKIDQEDEQRQTEGSGQGCPRTR
jgi:septum formation topological specificity factor MinE